MANRYWVGGTDTWDNVAGNKWALTSGGAGGQPVPTTNDAVFFDANSGANTITIGNGTAIASLLSFAGFTGTIAFGTNNITVTGFGQTIFTGASTLNVTGTPVIVFNYSGSTGSRILSSSQLNSSNAISFQITAGTDTVIFSNALNVDFTGFSGSIGNNTRSLFGDLKCSPNATWVSGANITTFAGTAKTQKITSNNNTLDFPITFNGVGSTFQLQDNLTVGSTRTVTLTNGTLDLNNLTLSCGFWSSSNSNTRSISFGTGNVTLTGSGTVIWDMATTTGFTYTGTPTVNCTYNGSTGTRTIRHSNTAGGSEANSVSFYVSAGTDGFATGSGALYKTLNFTGYTGALTNSARYIYGDFVAGSGMTITAGTSALTFLSASSTQNVTTNNVTFDFPITVNTTSGTVAFQDALTQGSTRAFTLTNGTLKFKAGVTSTVGSFATSGTNQKYLQSTLAGSQATLSDASGTNSLSYTTIQDINATGGATWNAYRSSRNVDAGNNTGWDFLSTPVTTATLAMRLGFGL